MAGRGARRHGERWRGRRPQPFKATRCGRIGGPHRSPVPRFLLGLLPCLVVGLVLGRVWPGLPFRLAPPLIRWGVPVSLVGLLLRAGLHPELVASGAMAALGTALGLWLLRLPAPRRWIPSGSLRLGSVSGNTAYWGLPVALALLPPPGIAHVITYDLVGTLITWSMGPLLVRGIPASAGAIGAALRTSPASRGLVVALALQLTPWSGSVASFLWLPAQIVILLSLALLGMRLGAMVTFRTPGSPTSPGLEAALAAKLLLVPALMLFLALALRLPPQVRAAVVLQAAAPTALSVLLLAEAGGRDGEAQAAAGLVLGSTLAALLTVPLWWTLLDRLGV
jgi:predicted permease